MTAKIKQSPWGAGNAYENLWDQVPNPAYSRPDINRFNDYGTIAPLTLFNHNPQSSELSRHSEVPISVVSSMDILNPLSIVWWSAS